MGLGDVTNQMIEALAALFPIEIKDSREEFKIKYKGVEKTFIINKEELNKNMKRYENMKFKDSLLYSSKYYESLVKFRSGYGYLTIDSNLEVKDEVNNIKYEISPPSHEYVIHHITELHRIYAAEGAYLLRDSFFRWRTGRKAFGEQKVEVNFLDFLARNVFGKTVKIFSSDSLKIDYLVKLKDAYLYNICYNLNFAVVEIKSFQEIFGVRGIRSFRNRLTIDNLEAPKVIYIPELINYYQSATSSENSAYEYLSFYHVIEYFFEAIYNQDLIKAIKSELTKPSFSYKKDSEVKKLISTIVKRVKKAGDENTIMNEQEALRLTLEKYIELKELKESLLEYDAELINHYRDNEVAFSGGNRFDLNDLSKPGELFRNLSLRVYKTRNSIVHSKESDKPVYNEFKDERILNKEIPLVRFIVEQIIYKNSNVIDIQR